MDSGAAVAYVDDSANLKPAGNLVQISGIPVLLPSPCELPYHAWMRRMWRSAAGADIMPHRRLLLADAARACKR